MPIYEFKCIECDEYIEILVMGNSDEKMAMKCCQMRVRKLGAHYEQHQLQCGRRRRVQIRAGNPGANLLRRVLHHLEFAGTFVLIRHM
jgi:hypothetical protein